MFSSDHTTEDGMDLLPVGRTIAFDCPAEGVHKSDIHVQITGGKDVIILVFKWRECVKVAACCNHMQITCLLI